MIGIYANGTVWVEPKKLPQDLAERYHRHLTGAINETDLSKQWFLRSNGLVDTNFLSAVKEGVEAVIKGIAKGG